MTMITPSYLGETIEYSSLHACRSTLEDPTSAAACLSVVVNTKGSSWTVLSVSAQCFDSAPASALLTASSVAVPPCSMAA